MKLTEQEQQAAFNHYIGAKPKFHKGKYGTKYDYYTCGNCGATLEIIADYCFKCGYRTLWDSPRCLTDKGAIDG